MMGTYNINFNINLLKKIGEDAMNLDFFEKSANEVRADLNTNSTDEYKLNDYLDIITIDDNESLTDLLSTIDMSLFNGSGESKTSIDNVSERNQNSQAAMIQQSSCFGLPELENTSSTLISAIKNEFTNDADSTSACYTDLAPFSIKQESDHELQPSSTFNGFPEDVKANTVASSSTWYKDLVSLVQEPEIQTDLEAPKTFDNCSEQFHYSHEPLFYQVLPDSSVRPVTPYCPIGYSPRSLSSPTFSSSSASSYSLPASVPLTIKTESDYELQPANGFPEKFSSAFHSTLGHGTSHKSPQIQTDLETPETIGNIPKQFHYSHKPLFYQVMPDSTVRPATPYYPIGYSPLSLCSPASSSSSGSSFSLPGSSSASQLKRKHRYVNEPSPNEPTAKKLKTEEEQNTINAMASQIPIYKTVPESESALSTGMCNIMLPYSPYQFEPKLYLAYVDQDKFAYRFITAGDLNTNNRCSRIQASPNPKPPQFWCLRCGLSFGRSTTARRHSKNIHQNSDPVYKKSYFVKLN